MLHLHGIYCYSFSLSGNEYQPEVVILVFLMKYIGINSSIPSITNYTYKVNYDIYIVNYNILKVVSGMGSSICILILFIIFNNNVILKIK